MDGCFVLSYLTCIESKVESTLGDLKKEIDAAEKSNILALCNFSPQRAHVILALKGTQLRSNDHVLFGVLVCFRHRRALTVHLCHLRSEHSGNVRIAHNLRLPRT